MENKLSNLVNELTETWLSWVNHNNIAMDKSLPYHLRRQSVNACEKLIDREHALTEKIDDIFRRVDEEERN